MSEPGPRNRRMLANALVVVSVATLLAVTVPAEARTAPTLAFLQGPSNQLAGQVIEPAVQVAMKDGRGQVNTRFTKSITVALQGVGGTLFGTKTIAAVAGVATFSDLVVDLAGSYALVASAGRLAPVTSNSFSITGVSVPCDSEGTCSGGVGVLEDPQTDSLAGFISTSVQDCADVCFLTLAEVASTSGSCGETTCTVGHGVKFLPPPNSTGTVTVQVSCDKNDCSGTGVPHFVFWIQDANGVVSQLDSCPNNPTAADMPCITSQSRTGVGDLLITIIKDASDPAVFK